VSREDDLLLFRECQGLVGFSRVREECIDQSGQEFLIKDVVV
jgi:hypothetical protein